MIVIDIKRSTKTGGRWSGGAVCPLLVDDNEADNYFHSRILKEPGITDHVEIAMDGEEALDFLIAKGKEGVAHRQDIPSCPFTPTRHFNFMLN